VTEAWPWERAGSREEGEIGARVLGVGEEQVIGTRLVLVHALLDQPHAEHPGVEIEILLRGTGDGGDVMEAGGRGHGISS
jgi:hypothetical protein